jgi:6-phosphogluconolactonase
MTRAQVLCATLSALLPIAASCDSDNDSEPPEVRPVVGAAYVATNEASNRVLAYTRTDDGALTFLSEHATQGQGTAGRVIPALDRVVVDPLFSQDSLVLTPDRTLLFVVNAGDGSISSFRINGDRSLVFADRESTGGAFPNTIATNGAGVLYVANVNSPNNPVNPGGTEPATLRGFRYGTDGSLELIPQSDRTLSSPASLPTQVLFNAAGDKLIVVELFAQTIAVHPLIADGTLATPELNPTAVNVFGLSPIGSNVLVSANVSPPMVMGTGGASSFALQADNTLVAITGSAPNGKTAPCWTAVTPDARFLYTSNLDDGDLSLFAVNGNGQIALIQDSAARKEPLGGVTATNVATSGPVDTFITADGLFLYQQYSGRGSIVAYRVGANGQLTETGEFGMDRLPLVGAEGLVGF